MISMSGVSSSPWQYHQTTTGLGRCRIHRILLTRNHNEFKYFEPKTASENDLTTITRLVKNADSLE